MGAIDEVIISMRHVRLDIHIPEEYVWEFIEEFTTFPDSFEDEFKSIDSYKKYLTCWEIQLSIREKYEEEFYNFLRDFCSKRNLLFKEPGTK